MPKPPAWFWSFRPLAWFWSAIATTAAATALILQILGPPSTQAATLSPAQPPAHKSQAAPPLSMTGTAIAEPSPDLLEPASGMPGQNLPRIAADGRKPSAYYAAAFDPDERHPRVALVIDGTGLDQEATRRLLHDLPVAIDVAWSAYTPFKYAGPLSRAARTQGRECLVSIPMEPAGFPASDEGSHALLTDAGAAVNWQNLLWSLSSVQGCVGATGASDGQFGERFAQFPQGYGDIHAEVLRRGLLYLDPTHADVIVDRAATPSEPATADMIDARLADLTRLASEHGSAIGLAGPPRPVMLERIAVWAHSLAAHGIVLAPLTAVQKAQ